MEFANKRRAVLGLVFILLGAVLLNNFFDFVPFRLPYELFGWEMVLILFGLFLVVGEKNRSTGIVLISIGGFFLIRDIFDLNVFDMLQILVPTLLILVGIKLLIPSKYKFWKSTTQQSLEFSESDRLEDVSVFGGGKKNVTSDNFQGGEVVCIFGGVDLNFKQTVLAPGHITLEVVCIFGGCTLYVPEDWTIRTDAVSIFGGFSDMRSKMNPSLVTNPNKVLIVKGVVIFGGGEIKSAW